MIFMGVLIFYFLKKKVDIREGGSIRIVVMKANDQLRKWFDALERATDAE